MEQILCTSQLDGGHLTLFFHGRIDSSNAKACEDQIAAARAGNTSTEVTVDAEDLAYMSSAGLRVILRLRKAEPTLSIINVAPEVYDVFEMTGFTEMLPISKAYRQISVDGCDIIGRGSNGIVYRLDPDTIVKVYRNANALPDIHRERELARTAFVLGIPTAIPYDVVRVGDTYGSVFELLSAKSFSKIIREDPSRTDEIVELFCNLLKKIHSTEVNPADFTDSREVVLEWGKFVKDYLPAEAGEKLVRLLEELPIDHHMLHGDYHTNNVMMQDGEVLLIDMDTLSYGSPIIEFASVYNAFNGFNLTDPDATEKFLKLDGKTARTVWEKTLKLYFATEDPAILSLVEKKSAVLGCTRLLRRTVRRCDPADPKTAKDIEVLKKMILDNLAGIDTLIL